MSLPPQYSGLPGEGQHRYYRNVCLEFKKAVKGSKDIDHLQTQMQRFINASKEVEWPHPAHDVYHKDEAEKALQKVGSEFQRYIRTLEADPQNAYPEDLLKALSVVETLIDRIKLR